MDWRVWGERWGSKNDAFDRCNVLFFAQVSLMGDMGLCKSTLWFMGTREEGGTCIGPLVRGDGMVF